MVSVIYDNLKLRPFDLESALEGDVFIGKNYTKSLTRYFLIKDLSEDGFNTGKDLVGYYVNANGGDVTLIRFSLRDLEANFLMCNDTVAKDIAKAQHLAHRWFASCVKVWMNNELECTGKYAYKGTLNYKSAGVKDTSMYDMFDYFVDKTIRDNMECKVESIMIKPSYNTGIKDIIINFKH